MFRAWYAAALFATTASAGTNGNACPGIVRVTPDRLLDNGFRTGAIDANLSTVGKAARDETCLALR